MAQIKQRRVLLRVRVAMLLVSMLTMQLATFGIIMRASAHGPQAAPDRLKKDIKLTAASTGASTLSIWPASAKPVNAAEPDGAAVELGLKFRSDVAGSVIGVRFYKARTNTGTHVGHLWTSTGTLLASATFVHETASGWQRVNFARRVAISPDTTYVVSYHTRVGHYSDDIDYFTGQGVNAGPLHALADNMNGSNGVYRYGTGGFPTEGWISSNYWVDVVFQPAANPAPSAGPLAPRPPSSWPDSNSTGVRPGVALTPWNRDIIATVSGQVIENLDIIDHAIMVEADNVVIKNVRIRCLTINCYAHGAYMIYLGDSATPPKNVLIQNVELDGGGTNTNQNSGNTGIGGGGYTCISCNVHGIGNGFMPWGSQPVTIQDSYVHDLYIRDDLQSHNQDIYINGTDAGVLIRHNNLENWDSQTATTLLDASWNGPIAHVTEDNNLFNGGGYEVYGGAPNNVSYIVFTNNHFGRKFYANGGLWGPSAYVDCGGPGNIWVGNVWDDTGQPVKAC